MPSEHRHVQRPHCNQQLRITVSKKNFGWEIEVTCSICHATFRTTVSYPARTHDEILRQVGERIMDKMHTDDMRILQPLMEEFGRALNNALSTNSDVEEVIERMRHAGYDPFFLLKVMDEFADCAASESP